ncbi:hypothetical protein BDY21DRAFT_177985 [Lineolata rhizophorae]|uniref:PHD finger and BAH domain protein n=1 Tax=Lineolata rhizophorae TaxID=578093 RepID=A0A6A6P7C5_9PEZI|nr:hypothetical protein BDY21DRAFT_177985 [Lineolata rhizophorae]
MEFIRAPNKSHSPVEQLRVNWYYRPRDVLRYNSDTRLVYATMHSDICPLTSLRGKCTILHRSEISDIDEYRRRKDSFWFNQVFDRFIHRWYEAIPVQQVINVPDNVKKALNERWKYVVVETGRVKELTAAVKLCKRCSGYCASDDSVDCAVCKNTYHMNCVRPPVLKKPSRGFAWACAPCGRAQERKLEARRTPIIGDLSKDAEEEELIDEEEEDLGPAETRAPSPNGSVGDTPGNEAEIALAKMWPMRYLGIHCRVEDALQYDDRAIYPRASSRLGPRHQANVNVWHGRPVELVKPAEIKRRYVKSGSNKKDTKLSKETLAALEADKQEKAKRPKWVMDEPFGFVHRGEDYPNDDPRNTAQLLFKMPSEEERKPGMDIDKVINKYIEHLRVLMREWEFARLYTPESILWKAFRVIPTNVFDKAMTLLMENKFDALAATKQIKALTAKPENFKEPNPTPDEYKRFVEGVAKYGSELRNVRLHVKTMPHKDIVRFYYQWKRTRAGRNVWGSYAGRKGTKKKAESESASRLVDDVADDQDDSAFDSNKAILKKRGFQCKFCSTQKSRQWRRAPGVTPGQTIASNAKAGSKDKGQHLVLALCQRCAGLWRKYAIQWENIDEVAKKVAQGGSKQWKRRFDEELLNELVAYNENSDYVDTEDLSESQPPSVEPPKKKQKASNEKEKDSQKEKDKESAPASAVAEPVVKKKPAPPPKQPTPPPLPAQPKFRDLPCAVCWTFEPFRDHLFTCTGCKLTVHRQCYGIHSDRRTSSKWLCDMCLNDRKNRTNIDYKCVLCPNHYTEQELVEPPKVSHKKKTDREREKERLEKELVIKAAEDYRRSQREHGRPEMPREPLKMTSNYHWVHVQCAIWTPGVEFSNAEALETVENIGPPAVPPSKYEQICKVCKENKEGACVTCPQCHGAFHVTCAQRAGYYLGFDIAPVKSTRKDVVTTVSLGGETGFMTAVIWCKEHAAKDKRHAMNDVVDETSLQEYGNALQLFARNYKQADRTLTGTARKAALLDSATKGQAPPTAAQPPPSNRRVSSANITVANRTQRSSAGATVKSEDQDSDMQMATKSLGKKCATCGVDVSPRWWPFRLQAPQKESQKSSSPDSGIAVNGTDAIGDGYGQNSSRQAVPQPNGVGDHADEASRFTSNQQPATSAAAAAMASAALTVDSGTSVPSGADAFQCHKCHVKKLTEPEKKEETRSSIFPEAPLPSRSPPILLGATIPQWIPPGSIPPTSFMGGIPMHPHGLPPPAPVGAHIPSHPPYQAPLPPHHHMNGYPPPPGGPVLPPHMGTGRSPYPPQTAPPPPPIHVGNAPAHPLVPPQAPNGLHSSHVPIPSPTRAGVPPQFHSRQTDNPFQHSAGHGQPMPPFHPPPQAGSPGQVQNRPVTPRDAHGGGAEGRASAGASASPSLRNLLQ